MNFPISVKDRKTRAEAVIHGKTVAYPSCRVAHQAAGEWMLLSFRIYTEAHKKAKATVKALAKGKQSVTRTAKEAADVRDIDIKNFCVFFGGWTASFPRRRRCI